MWQPLPGRESHPIQRRTALACSLVVAAWGIGFAAPPSHAQSDIRFETLDNATAGLDYLRAPSPRLGRLQALEQGSLTQPLGPNDLPLFPGRVFGIAGLVVFDPDLDGDLDLFVTNGPGRANSLFINQWLPAGSLRFEDHGSEAGVAATEMEGSGACYGDLDNDGDPDLLVLGMNEPNRLFENRGNAADGQVVFEQVTFSGLEGGDSPSTSCAIGDIDGDGLLDVFIGNNWDQSSLLAIFVEPFALSLPNELYRNEGGLRFGDVSESSGIRAFATLPPGASTLTWSASLVDIDLDGDQDLVHADDQGAFPNARDGGIDRGLLHVFLNDGSGHFTDNPIILDAQAAGSWMGVGFGDLDCDGTIDILGSNFGDYGIPVFGAPYTLGDQQTRWFLGNGDGSFTQPGPGDLVASVFGWGNAIADLDLDGDQDMLYLGGLLIGLVALTDNPGTVLENIDCGTRFERVATAFTSDFRRRPVSGVAIGDLDRDQRPDVVTASSFEVPEALPLLPPPVAYGSPFDAVAAFTPVFVPTPAGFVWSGVDLAGGRLEIERNASTGRGITVRTLGTVGLLEGGRNNRDGIGAVLSFRPHRGRAVLVPIQGGSSHASQHADEAYFGLGNARFGTLEVLWPGGVRNRLYGVRAGETLRMPEIPCSFDDPTRTLGGYLGCVLPSLGRLRRLGLISHREAGRLFVSALRAFLASH